MSNTMTLAEFRKLKHRDFENGAVLDAIESVIEERDQLRTGTVPVGNNVLPPEEVTARLYECKSQRDDETWAHAACLTIAETGQKWGANVTPSLAMEAVYKLYHDRVVATTVASELMAERDELQRQVNCVIESCYYRTAAGKVHWKQGRWFGTSTADDTDPAAFEQAMAAIRQNAGIGEQPVLPPEEDETEVLQRVCDRLQNENAKLRERALNAEHDLANFRQQPSDQEFSA